MHCKKLFSVVLMSALSLWANTRFIDSVFSSIETVPSVQYRTASDYQENDVSLLFDLYQPQSDTLSMRPLVLVFHGGAFIEGVGGRDDDFSASTAAYLAKMGYVTASLDYRCGFPFVNPASEVKKAAYRALQDARAAVRFFKAGAGTYKIDTSAIFLCGYSAGGIIAINSLHLTEDKFGDTSGLGPLETGDNLSFSSSVKGAIAFAGAVLDTGWITAQAAPSICFHGTADETVPYESGYAFGSQLMPFLYGSGAINRVSQEIGYNNKLVTYEGEGHEFVSSHPLLFSSLDTAAVFISALLNPLAVKNPFIAYKHSGRSGNGAAFVNYSLFDISGRAVTEMNKKATGLMYLTVDKISGKLIGKEIVHQR